MSIPSLRWEMKTPKIEEPESIPNVTGGFVVGSFEIVVPELEEVLQYRLIHEYRYDQSPEEHLFLLTGENSSNATVRNFRFGHSYGYLDSDDLWDFGEEIGEWLTEDDNEYPLEQVPEITIDWDGLLPYPPGDVSN